MATRPPFRCAECRRDLTAWFVAKFDWVDTLEQDVAEQRAVIRLLAAERDREYERDAMRTAELYRRIDEGSRAHLDLMIAEGTVNTNRLIEQSRRSIAENYARFNADVEAANARQERFLADMAALSRRG